MKQKIAITIADVNLSVVCDEDREIVEAAAATLNDQIRHMIESTGYGCTRIDAALFAAMEYIIKCNQLTAKLAERDAEIAEHSTVVAGLEQTIVENAGEIEALEGNKADLEAQLAERDTAIEDMRTAASEIDARLASATA